MPTWNEILKELRENQIQGKPPFIHIEKALKISQELVENWLSKYMLKNNEKKAKEVG